MTAEGGGRLSILVLQGLTHDLGNLMQIRGMKSAVYSALTVAILGAGSAFNAMPYESLTNMFTYAKGPDCIMLWRSIGAALLMLPTWTYNLKARQYKLSMLCCSVCRACWKASERHL